VLRRAIMQNFGGRSDRLRYAGTGATYDVQSNSALGP
jgi:hypothetical protein